MHSEANKEHTCIISYINVYDLIHILYMNINISKVYLM